MKNTAEHLYRRLPSPYGQLCQCCDSREAHHGRHGEVERKAHLAVDGVACDCTSAVHPRHASWKACIRPLQSGVREAIALVVIWTLQHWPIHLLISFKSIYLHNHFSQSMSTATKRTAALLLRQPKCHQAGQSLTSSGEEGVPRRCPVQHFHRSSLTRE
ncbi:hypothetical protein SRHO_G00344770 [Serrasalmus rhombeus]